MFTKILIANRGEVALRINSTLVKMGIEAVGIYTKPDHGSLHVQAITESYLIDGSQQNGYLDSEAIIAIALRSGCAGIHPGYGFLSENPLFAQACQISGLTFIGPPALAMRAMGEKISARENAIRAGVPVLPGVGVTGMSDEELLAVSREMIFPLLVKPAAGGGGKGLHLAQDFNELREILPSARREAKKSFGDENLLIEKYLNHARHIEFQVVADQFGEVMHLGERECSLQRRHQKVIEESPAPQLSQETRERMGAAAISLTSAIGYQNLGTIEFLIDRDNPETFYFMEMNTRLQVEHRVTELTTGLDLVECQLRLAAGDRLAQVIPERNFSGHAIEARIYAEDAFNGFLPTGGVVNKFRAATFPHTVTDAAISDGDQVSSSFDPMLAKVASWGEDRGSALENLQEALSHTLLLGVTTNLNFLINLLDLDDIKKYHYDTKYLEAEVFIAEIPPLQMLEAYADLLTRKVKNGPWRSDGWRLHGAPLAWIAAYVEGVLHEVSVEANSHLEVDFYRGEGEYWLHHPSFGTWVVKDSDELGAAKESLQGAITSPMPGVVIALKASLGDHVAAGDPLMVIEAMKMEHIVRAPRAGRVTQCHVALGAKVRVGEVLLEVQGDV